MLLVVLFAIMVIGIVLYVIGNIDWEYNKNKLSDFLFYNGDAIKFAGIVMLFVTIFSSVYLIGYARAEQYGSVKKLENKYITLINKIESGACRDTNGYLINEIIDEIEEYNNKIIYFQKKDHDFWLGIFYSDIYDDFKIIEYDISERKEQ